MNRIKTSSFFILSISIGCFLLAKNTHSSQVKLSRSKNYVLPLSLPDTSKDRDVLVPGERTWVDVVYLASPGGTVLHEDQGEEIWWLQDQAVLLLGSKSLPLPDLISERSSVWVQVFIGDSELENSPFELFPLKGRIPISKNSSKMQKSLQGALATVNATFLSQVVNYLAENLATLNVDASTYSIDNVPVINANRQWVGEPIGGGGDFSLPYAGATSSNSIAAFSVTNSSPFPSSSGIEASSGAASYALHVTGTPLRGLMIDEAMLGIQIAASTTDGMYVGACGSPTAQSSSSDINGIELAGSEDNGVYVGYAGQYGLKVESAGVAGVEVVESDGAGLVVVHSGYQGLNVLAADTDGVGVLSAGENAPAPIFSTDHNGLEVNAAEGNGIYLGNVKKDGLFLKHSDSTGIYIEDTTLSGVSVGTAQTNGFTVAHAGTFGLQITQADATAIVISSTKSNGVFISHSGTESDWADAFHVAFSGNPSSTSDSDLHNGLEVEGAEGHGVYVGRADEDGVHIDSAGGTGVVVQNATTGFSTVHSTNYGITIQNSGSSGLLVRNSSAHGIDIDEADSHGIRIQHTVNDGIHVSPSDGTGVAGYFDGGVTIVGGCTGCSTMALAKNTSNESLERGDVVTVNGMTNTPYHNAQNITTVSRASDQDAVYGVVIGTAKERTLNDSTMDLIPCEGISEPGEYVHVVIFGQALVKVNALNNPVEPGKHLTASDRAGYARAVESVESHGKRFMETSAIIGTALESLEDSEDLIWVMVNPR
jgi:hypothetical protein